MSTGLACYWRISTFAVSTLLGTFPSKLSDPSWIPAFEFPGLHHPPLLGAYYSSYIAGIYLTCNSERKEKNAQLQFCLVWQRERKPIFEIFILAVSSFIYFLPLCYFSPYYWLCCRRFNNVSIFFKCFTWEEERTFKSPSASTPKYAGLCKSENLSIRTWLFTFVGFFYSKTLFRFGEMTSSRTADWESELTPWSLEVFTLSRILTAKPPGKVVVHGLWANSNNQ